MSLDSSEVEHIAKLARIKLSITEIEHLQDELSTIIDYFEILNQVDVGDVPATMHILNVSNVVRGDNSDTSLQVDDTLANAPRRDGDQFRVRSILE